MKMYEIVGEIITYETYDGCKLGLGMKGRSRHRQRWKGSTYPKVINFKTHENLLEGVKRLIMRRNPVD